MPANPKASPKNIPEIIPTLIVGQQTRNTNT
jgi:hypothetical protein